METTRRPSTPEKMGDPRAEHLDVELDLKGMETGSISADDPIEQARMKRLLYVSFFCPHEPATDYLNPDGRSISASFPFWVDSMFGV